MYSLPLHGMQDLIARAISEATTTNTFLLSRIEEHKTKVCVYLLMMPDESFQKKSISTQATRLEGMTIPPLVPTVDNFILSLLQRTDTLKSIEKEYANIVEKMVTGLEATSAYHQATRT